jgi:hypothetical protein
MPDSNPILFILNHKSSILPIHYRNGQKAKKTWNRLKDSLPELQQVMKFNTFKQYLSVITAVTSNLGAVTEEKTAVRQILSNSPIVLKDELDKVRQESDQQPKRILGWNVRKAKDGYYRCYRKINNQVHSIYLGKTIKVHKAQQRIKEKEKNLKLDKS